MPASELRLCVVSLDHQSTMGPVLTPTSLRRSSRKRVHSSHLDSDADETQDDPRVVVARKRQAVEFTDTDTPTRTPRARRSAVPVGGTQGAQGE